MKLYVIIQAQHIFGVPAGFQNPPLKVVYLLTAGRRSATDDNSDSCCFMLAADHFLEHLYGWICTCCKSHVSAVARIAYDAIDSTDAQNVPCSCCLMTNCCLVCQFLKICRIGGYMW